MNVQGIAMQAPTLVFQAVECILIFTLRQEMVSATEEVLLTRSVHLQGHHSVALHAIVLHTPLAPSTLISQQC